MRWGDASFLGGVGAVAVECVGGPVGGVGSGGVGAHGCVRCRMAVARCRGGRRLGHDIRRSGGLVVRVGLLGPLRRSDGAVGVPICWSWKWLDLRDKTPVNLFSRFKTTWYRPLVCNPRT